ncbi:MAG: hypothetical protein KF699_00120 [Phycisphaeraceae bacterium]|nr:hypothetical protein [Phycisphaeraceae bacterium]
MTDKMIFRTRCCALLVAGAGAAAFVPTAAAQYFGVSTPAMMYYGDDDSMMGGQGMPRGRSFDDEIPDFDPFESRGRRGAGPDQDPRLTPKTDLGKRIAQLDFTRDQQWVLAARARLAAQRRELMLNPPPPAPADGGDKPAGAMPAAVEPAPAGGDAMPAMPDFPLDALPPGMTPEQAMEMVRAAMAEMAAMGLDPEDMDDEDFGDMAMPRGMLMTPGQPGAGPMTPEQMKAMQEKQAEITRQAERFRVLVIAGDWPAVGEFLATEAGEDALAIYNIMLMQLQMRDQAMTPDEVIDLSDICPAELDEKFIERLGAILKSTQRRGSQAGAVAAKIRLGTRHFGGEDPAARKRAATLLVAAGLPVEAQAYLPPLAQAREAKDPELLNLYGVYFAALAKDKQGAERQAAIDQGWDVCREVMLIETAPAVQRAKALERALGFLADVPQESGDGWLASLFADPASDVGWKAIDRAAARARVMRQQQRPADDRLKALLLVRRVGNGVLAGAGEGVGAWRTGLNMLTVSILEEAELTRAQRQPNERMPVISSDQLNSALPDAPWLAAIDPGLAAKLEVMVASTSGGAGDSEAVLAMIRPIVATDPERARKLAEALIAAWPTFVKPQPNFNEYGYYGGYNPYMYGRRYYGGYGTSGATPLTRAKQRRNLDKLAWTLDQLRTLGLGDMPNASVVEAFAASHSDAEVYDLPDIERVFGGVGSLSNELRRSLAANMRSRLVSTWRNPQIQQQNQTRRNDREMAQEVLRGYDVAIALLPPMDASADPAAWEGACTLADLMFDKSEFLYGQKADLATYSEVRNQAFYHYARAAAMYRDALATGLIKPSARIFVQWFSSALGASDLAQLTRQDAADSDQVGAVRAAIERLPDGQAQRHIGLFAKEIVSNSQRTNPELKPRYMRHAAAVIGDHPDGKSIRERVAYYDDLLREIELTVSVDGPTQVGHGDAFGAHLAVWCTRAVSRESGGFGKYLQNQQWHPMTGQQVDFRDDLEKQIRETLSERFEVQTVYFHKPQVQPISLPRAGWEQWPLAYILLKPRDSSVDRIVPLKMDMDFSDGQGMVILPVTSQVVLIDSKDRQGAARTLGEASVEQVLDARSAIGEESSGVLRLEVRAKGKGLVPTLDKIVDLAAMRGYEVVKTEDQGLNILELDTSGETVVPVTERGFSLEIRPTVAKPTSFTFPTVRLADAKVALKHYADADIVDAQPTIAVAGIAGRRPWWLAPAVGGITGALVAAVLLYIRARLRRRPSAPPPRLVVPDHLSPVGAIALLRRVLNGPDLALSAPERAQLSAKIEELEQQYFAPPNGHGAPPANRELVGVVREWVGRAVR